MKLVLLDLHHPPRDTAWLTALGRANVALASTGPLPPPAAAALPAEPIAVGRIESYDALHRAMFEPLFVAALDAQQPRLPEALVSFPQTADFALFSETRHAAALLYDLERLALEHQLSAVELVSDTPGLPACYDAARQFARGHRLPWRYRSQGPQGLPAWKRLARDRWLDAAAAARRWAVLLHTCRQSRRNVDYGDRADGQLPTAAAVRAALLSYHANGWDHLLAIRSALIEAGHSAVPLSPRDRTDAWLDQHGVPYLPLNGPPPGSDFVAAAVDWANQAPLELSDPVLEQTGRSGGPLRWFLRVVAFHAAWLYARSAPTLGQWLPQQRFNMVLGTDSGSVAGRCLFRTAKASGLPAVFVQHGSLTTRPGVDRYIAASHCLMWGELSCENLARAGATPMAALPAGSPLLESRLLAARHTAQRSTAPEANRVLVAFGVPGGLFGDASFAQAAGALARAARELADTKFIVKLHPGDSGDLWRRAIDDAATANLTIERSASTYALLARCRLLVTMQSTLGSEAAVLDKPVVALNFDRVHVGTEFLAAGSAYELFDAAAVLPCLKELLDGPPGTDRLAETRRAFARRFLTLTDEPAAERIVRHLADLVPCSTTTPRPDACQPASR